MYKRHIIGKEGEDLCVHYLKLNGYKIIRRNFSCRQGEIDIIAKDIKTREYVFIEVKTRTNSLYGNPADAVNKIKQKHIILATKYYIHVNGLYNVNIRFDVIEVLKKEKVYINHIKRCDIN